MASLLRMPRFVWEIGKRGLAAQTRDFDGWAIIYCLTEEFNDEI